MAVNTFPYIKNKYFIFVFSLFMFSCVSDVKVGYPQKSNSIKISKKLKVFLVEYIPSKRVIKINDTLTYKIDEVWLEQEWSYKNTDYEIQKEKNINWIIVVDKDPNQLFSYGDTLPYRFRMDDKLLDGGLGYGITYPYNLIHFRLSEKGLKKDTIKIDFYTKEDTISIDFIKKK